MSDAQADTSPEPRPAITGLVAVVPSRGGQGLVDLLTDLEYDAVPTIVVDGGFPEWASLNSFDVRIICERPNETNISRWWNLGVDQACLASCDVLVLNDDVRLAPGAALKLQAALHAHEADVVFPDWDGRLEDSRASYGPHPSSFPFPWFVHDDRMSGWCFMISRDCPITFDEQFRWWYGDTDFERRVRLEGRGVVRVGSVRPDDVRHLRPNVATLAAPELQALAAEDERRFRAKWSGQ